MLGLKAGLEVLVPAIEQGLCIGVAGDYDADGVTGTALLVEFLEQAGAKVVWELPHRISDGYGFSPGVAERLSQAGTQVVVTVDCGSSDHAGVGRANELGMEVVVSDHHHMPGGPLVPARAVINPQQADCPFESQLAGAGVAFYLAAGLRAALQKRGWFASRPKPNLLQSLDLVALGTLADVAPLTGINRVLVRHGLEVMSRARRPGLAALMGVAGLASPLSERDISFGLAPRINAPGRLDSARISLELLLADGPGPGGRLAKELDEANQERKKVERGVLDDALARAEAGQGGEHFTVLAAEGWHRGVLGIVASRLMEVLGRPVLMLSLNNGSASGSGRSLPGFHLQKALTGCQEILSHYGGHELAAGVTLPSEMVPELSRRLDQAAAQQMPPTPGAREIMAEAQAEAAELGPTAMSALERLAPFGNGNPEPRLLVRNVKVLSAREVGVGHLKLDLTTAGRRLGAIGFNLAHLRSKALGQVDLICIPRISSFRGRHLELEIVDLRPAR